MLLFVLRKMASNRWMVASLLAGVILAVAMVTAIPIYSRGILTRLLLRDLQGHQEATGLYPGLVEIDGLVPADPGADDPLGAYDAVSATIQRQVARGLPVPLLATAFRLQHHYLRARRADRPDADGLLAPMATLSGFLERVKPLIGRLPAPRPDGATVEVVISEETAAAGELVYDQEYELLSPRDDLPTGMRARVVGVVAPEDPADVYWSSSARWNQGVMIALPEAIRRPEAPELIATVFEAEWYFLFDYQAMSSEEAAPLVAFVDAQEKAALASEFSIRMPAREILSGYARRERTLRLTLWVLQVPLLLMLAFYLFMVSQVLIDHERNEIAVLKSRGADARQVFLTYVMLGSLLTAAGLCVGPPLGLLACRILGASSGFLEFVRRRTIRLDLTPQTYRYAAAAAVLAMAAMLLPAVRASRTTIVHHKQRLAESTRRPVWKMLFLDLVALAIAGYGIYLYRTRARLVEVTGLAGTELSLDPLLLAISTFFIVGLGLLFLRFYPPVVRLVFRIGRRRWSPGIFSSLVQVGRAGGRDQFLMLFIILSISIGVFNADTARTLNANAEEQIRYRAGADVVIKETWMRLPGRGATATASAAEADLAQQPTGSYVEPPFGRFRDLPGVVAATRVYRQGDASGQKLGGDPFGNLTLMGVVSHEFATVAWFRPGLLPHHWYTYLNLLAASPAAALVSTSLRDAGLQLGDAIYLQARNQPPVVFSVYGFVDFWPTYNPYAGGTGGNPVHLAVVNLDYLQAMTALEPYEVWIDLDPAVGTQAFYESVRNADIAPHTFVDVQQQVIRARNDPMLQGTNGLLSLGFIVSLGICFAGFLIFWTFSIRERTLQFGLFRAMGMSKGAIVRMLALEQVLVSGVAVAVGFLVGSLTSRLYAPLLQVANSAGEIVPPFRIISLVADRLRIGAFVFVMLALGFAILSVFLTRIRIHQAVKLGEE